MAGKAKTEEQVGASLSLILGDLRAVRQAALAQFAAECNAEHARLYNEGARSDVYQERHQSSAETLYVCFSPPGMPTHPLREDFVDSFERLSLDIYPAALFGVLSSIPATEAGNERLRAVDFAVSVMMKFDDEAGKLPTQSKLSDSPLRGVRMIEKLSTNDSKFMSFRLKNSTDSFGSHPAQPDLELGSFADLTIQLEQYHVAACMLAVVLFRIAELRSKLIPFKLWAGMTRQQMKTLIRDYEVLATHLAPTLRRMLPEVFELRREPAWFETSTKEELWDVDAMLAAFQARVPGKLHIARYKAIWKKNRSDVPELRKRLFNEVLFLHRPVGCPRVPRLSSKAKNPPTEAQAAAEEARLVITDRRAPLLASFRERHKDMLANADSGSKSRRR